MATSQQPECVAFLSGDLMFASRVKAAAENAGLTFWLGGSLPQVGDTPPVAYVILDLSTRASLSGEIAQQCAQRFPTAQLIAYGPHVQVAKLKAAREAGIKTVLTRSQFDSVLGSMFRGGPT